MKYKQYRQREATYGSQNAGNKTLQIKFSRNAVANFVFQGPNDVQQRFETKLQRSTKFWSLLFARSP